MLATISPMINDVKPPHDHHAYKFHHNRYSPPESPQQLPPFLNGGEATMTSSHRGLPAPLGLSLAPPERPPTSSTSLGNLPAPPSQWSGHDESMRNWLVAKAEEDRRKQEEERTKQETLRLDQRKIEQNMLRDSLSGGVPPPMVPLIFAGMAGQGNLSNHTLEWAQQYLAQLSLENQRQQQQLQAQQHQLQHHQQQAPPPPPPPSSQEPHSSQHQGPPSPTSRRDSRILPPNPYAAPTQAQAQAQATIAPSQPQTNRALSHSISNSSLSRLNTIELQPQSMSASTPQSRHTQHPLQQSQTAQSETSSGPSLFFHHWTPPSSSNQPPTPATKSQQVSPHAQHPASHLRSDYQNTPKKRKLGTGQNNSAPGSQHMDNSPHDMDHREYSPRKSPERSHSHSREHSDTSSRGEHRPIARPSSRQQRHDESLARPGHYAHGHDDRHIR